MEILYFVAITRRAIMLVHLLSRDLTCKKAQQNYHNWVDFYYI